MTGAPFTATEEQWRGFAKSIAEQALVGYEAGEMDLRQLLDVVGKCSKGGGERYRKWSLGVIADRALSIAPKFLNAKKPPFPQWFKSAAVELVLLHEETGLDRAIERAISWLMALDLYGHLSPATLRRWVLEHKKEKGVPVKRGRRPKV